MNSSLCHLRLFETYTTTLISYSIPVSRTYRGVAEVLAVVVVGVLCRAVQVGRGVGGQVRQHRVAHPARQVHAVLVVVHHPRLAARRRGEARKGSENQGKQAW
jgi:hypothetical protein